MTPKIKTFLRIFKIADLRQQQQNEKMNSIQKDFHLKELIGDCLLSEREIAFYNQNCEGIVRSHQVVAEPKSEVELQDLIMRCNKFKQPYSVFSGGNNWGYGTSLSVNPSDLLISLKSLQGISNYDEDIGTLTLQAGVTQEILYKFLLEKDSPWMLPTTGAGPKGSIIGNGLERGFGLNPTTDHFFGLQSFRVLLPNGNFLDNNLTSHNATESAKVSRWGTGPYLDGLFSQSNFGIVTQAQVNLTPKPKEVFLLVIKASKEEFSELIRLIQNLRTLFPGFLAGINISDKARLSSTTKTEYSQTNEFFHWCERILQLDLKDYQAIVPISIFADDQKVIAKLIYKFASQSLKCALISEGKLKIANALLNSVKQAYFKDIKSKTRDAAQLCNLLKGVPSDFALKTAYLQEPTRDLLNPATDGVGILWYAPILPLKTSILIEFQNLCSKILTKYSQKIATTITNFDSRLCEATIPILFDRNSPTEVANALKCWEELYNESLKLGLSPYRFSILHMDKAISPNPTNNEILQSIKKAVDPDNLFARNRYSN